jgi:hypothetical protein
VYAPQPQILSNEIWQLSLLLSLPPLVTFPRLQELYELLQPQSLPFRAYGGYIRLFGAFFHLNYVPLAAISDTMVWVLTEPFFLLFLSFSMTVTGYRVYGLVRAENCATYEYDTYVDEYCTFRAEVQYWQYCEVRHKIVQTADGHKCDSPLRSRSDSPLVSPTA